MIEVVYNCKDCNRLFSEHHHSEEHTDPGCCPLCKSTSGKIEKLGDKALRRNGSQTFYSLLGKAADIHDSKSHDYASNSDPLGNYRFAGELAKLFVDPTDSGLIGRFGEKLYRLSNLDKSGKTEKNEPVNDTEIDLLVIIGLFVADRQDRRMKEREKYLNNILNQPDGVLPKNE